MWTSGTPKGASPIVPAKVATPAKKVARTMPAFTRGVHVSSPWVARPGNLDRVLATPGLNLLQLDVKDEGGEVAGFGAARRRSPRIGAPRDYYDLAHVTRLAHDRGIYVVARIVSFKDPIVARPSPGVAIRDVQGRRLEGRRRRAVDQPVQPRRLEVPDRLAKAAARSGVDEVQFDYVRFPSEGSLSDMRFPGKVKEPLDATMPRFLAEARKALKPFGVKLGVDVFGLAADHDLGIGQDIAQIAQARRRDLADGLPVALHARASSASPIPTTTRAAPSRSRWALPPQLIAAPKSSSGRGCRTSAATR